MREIIFDTETTGLNARDERLVSVAAIEMVDGELTGAFAHWHLNPGKPSHPRALEVHGLTDEYLSTQPRFADIWPDLKGFFRDSKLIIHNAAFDLGFLAVEIARTMDPRERWDPVSILPPTLCTYQKAVNLRGMAKGRNTLDALTKAYGTLDIRTITGGKHGALIDCVQLYGVYRALNGEPQVPLLQSLLDHYSKGFGVYGNLEHTGQGSASVPASPAVDPSGQPAEIREVG